jgi:hypothetical protein
MKKILTLTCARCRHRQFQGKLLSAGGFPIAELFRRLAEAYNPPHYRAGEVTSAAGQIAGSLNHSVGLCRTLTIFRRSKIVSR